MSYLRLRHATIKNLSPYKMTNEPESSVEEDLKELLKRCPPGTYESALLFRNNKDINQVEKIVLGIIDRHLEPEQREILAKSDDTLRMYEDLGMDSLTMLEIVMLVEQTLEVSIDNEELRDLRTIGDVKTYLSAKAKGEEPPKLSKTYRIEEIASLMPHREPFLFLETVSINDDQATARYKISGNEYFLEGHFKENPVFPASIMIEALGQLCVFYLLKGDHPSLTEKVDPNTIFFTSCDGVKCRRICKPGDILEMQIKVNRVRHPLASFQGDITVEGQKTATAEEVKLAFDYYPVIDGETGITAKKRVSTNGNGTHSNEQDLVDKQSLTPRFEKYSDKS
jgi:acyl carrier protein